MTRSAAIVFVSIFGAAVALGKSKVVVFPVVPLAGEVDAGPAREMSEALVDELKGSDNIEVVIGSEPAAAVSAEASGRRPTKSDNAYRVALRELADGARQAQRLRFPQAIRALTQGIAGLTDNLDLLEDYRQLVDAYVLLAVAHFRRGQQAAGTDVLEDVARLVPDLELDPAQYPPVFLNVFADVQKRALERPRGSLHVTSAPAGAKVFLNGKPMGTTPLLIEEVIPGANHLVVRLDDAAWGRVVKVTEGRTTEQHANLGAGGPDAPLTLGDAMAANRLDREARATARRLGREQGGDYVLLAVIGKGKGVYAVGSVLGSTRNGKWETLAPAAPDFDMLSTAIEAHNIARDVAAKVVNFDSNVNEAVVPFIAGKAMRSPTHGKGLPEQHATFVKTGLPTARAARQPVVASGEGTPAPSRAPVESAATAPARREPPPVTDTSREPVSLPAVASRMPAKEERHDSTPKEDSKAVPTSQPASAAAARRPVGKNAAGFAPELAAIPLEAPPPKKKAEAAAPRRGPVVGAETGIDKPEKGDLGESIAAVEAAKGGSGPLAASPPADLAAEAGGGIGPLWEKWWFWTGVGVAAVGLGAGSYLLFFNDFEPTSARVSAQWQ